jgi:hypothetical protein
MCDDLYPGRHEVPEQLLAARVDLAADGIDLKPDVDTGLDAGLKGIEEQRPDVAGLVAIDQQVHGR